MVHPASSSFAPPPSDPTISTFNTPCDAQDMLPSTKRVFTVSRLANELETVKACPWSSYGIRGGGMACGYWVLTPPLGIVLYCIALHCIGNYPLRWYTRLTPPLPGRSSAFRDLQLTPTNPTVIYISQPAKTKAISTLSPLKKKNRSNKSRMWQSKNDRNCSVSHLTLCLPRHLTVCSSTAAFFLDSCFCWF